MVLTVAKERLEYFPDRPVTTMPVFISAVMEKAKAGRCGPMFSSVNKPPDSSSCQKGLLSGEYPGSRKVNTWLAFPANILLELVSGKSGKL